MDPRFTRGEYWLLDTVVEFRFPVSGLMDSNLEENLNKKGAWSRGRIECILQDGIIWVICQLGKPSMRELKTLGWHWNL